MSGLEVVAADLADPHARTGLVEELDRRGVTVDILVDDAGFGIYSAFAASDPAASSSS